jgi:dTDP-4-amino-4,6-dideoxygalactose transaminase
VSAPLEALARTVGPETAAAARGDPLLERYESGLAGLLAVDQVIAFGFARHSLIALLQGLGLRRGDHVLLSPLTCKVVPLALQSLGLIPAYADLMPDAINLEASGVASRLTPEVRAIVFQRTYGSAVGASQVAALAAKVGVPLVEDCAHSLPTRGPVTGATAAIFSNNLLKPLPVGSGGLAATGDGALARRVRQLRDALPRPGWVGDTSLGLARWAQRHVLGPRTYWPLLALRRRLDRGDESLALEIRREIERTATQPSRYQLRIGVAALSSVRANADHRRAACEAYREALTERPGLSMPAPVTDEPLLYFPVLVPHKSALLAEARRRHLEIVAWPGSTPIYPIERADALNRYGYAPGSCPGAERVARSLVGLPTDPRISPPHRARIIDLVAGWRR